MKSEIRVASNNLRVIVPVTLISAAAVVILAAMFRVEFGAILLSIAFAIGGIAGLAIVGRLSNYYHAAQLAKIERHKAQQELRIVTYEADKAQFQRHVLHFSKNERIVLPQDAPVKLIEAAIEAPKVVEGKAELLPPRPVNLLPALDSVQRCLVVGASDSGKTTLMKWIVYRRLHSSKVVVIDPHSYPGKWAGCYVIGKGRDYEEIGRALTALIALMDKRYDEIGRGIVPEAQHAKIAILIDEWRAIVGNLGKPASEAIKALLTESRKAAFSVFLATHSDRAKPLGLEGEYDLKDGFAVVRLAIVNGQRTATLDTGNGEQAAQLPGPFNQAMPTNTQPDFELDLEPEPTEQDEQDALFVELVQQGTSRRQAAQAAYGKDYAGALVSHCKQLLGEI